MSEVKLTKADVRMLRGALTFGGMFYSYNKSAKKTAARLAQQGLVTLGETDLGPALYITPAGRLALEKTEGGQ